MGKLLIAAAAILALAGALTTGGQARPAAAPATLTVTLTSQAVVAAPARLAPGRRAVVVRNLSAAGHDVRILRVAGGTAALVRFEGFRFAPTGSRVVADLGHVAFGGAMRRTVRLVRGSYVVASFAGSAVVAARDLTVA
jgi:hypothetical protein